MTDGVPPTDGPIATEDAASSASRVRVRLRHFSRSLPMLLLRAREAVMRHFRASLRRHGITEQQWRILRALSNGSRIEVTELARATYLLGPSLSRILKDLEAENLIERRPDPVDLRRTHVTISRAGLELIERISPESEMIYATIAKAVGPERMAELQRLLEELETAMQRLGPIDLGLPADDSEAG
jgi:homoprotocatechuate degradation regulator HpaR